VAIIMDGNGRWAQLRGQPRPEGHRAGAAAVRKVVREARKLGIGALTLFAFSEQNWQRPDAEVSALMALLMEFLVNEREELLENQIALRAIGRVDRLPVHVREGLAALSSETAHGARMTLTLALSYGGREELVDTVRAVAAEVAAGELDPDGIDEALLDARIPSVQVGAVDLLIRTGAEQRISNFLLWGAAYAELYFSSKLWPEFDEGDLRDALDHYKTRERRFGRVADSRRMRDDDRGDE
jgi:undecaprenyl diphosphate synthase